jgi:S-adenosylmethionine synthetase
MRCVTNACANILFVKQSHAKMQPSNSFLFTSESVGEGHPDKVCDFIADSILDAHLEQDPRSRVACEVLCKHNHVVLAGEVTSTAQDINYEKIVRGAIEEIGYTDSTEAFNAAAVHITNLLGLQSKNIGQGVDTGGAGDQGMMFGFATDETSELMPLPITLAHRLSRTLAKHRKQGIIEWGRPDAKTQVTVRYAEGKPLEVATVVVSTQHAKGTPKKTIRNYVQEELLPATLGRWHRNGIKLHVNPTGAFEIGGPTGDCGLTGRKIIVDSYGGFARHGGGAFSGKDPTKVDRSGAYFARYVAQNIIRAGLAHKAEVQVAYAIGVAEPVSLMVDTFGTGDPGEATAFAARFDFRPRAIIERLGLRKSMYKRTTNYGHFGKRTLPWEEVAKS